MSKGIKLDLIVETFTHKPFTKQSKLTFSDKIIELEKKFHTPLMKQVIFWPYLNMLDFVCYNYQSW